MKYIYLLPERKLSSVASKSLKNKAIYSITFPEILSKKKSFIFQVIKNTTFKEVRPSRGMKCFVRQFDYNSLLTITY